MDGRKPEMILPATNQDNKKLKVPRKLSTAEVWSSDDEEDFPSDELLYISDDEYGEDGIESLQASGSELDEIESSWEQQLAEVWSFFVPAEDRRGIERGMVCCYHER